MMTFQSTASRCVLELLLLLLLLFQETYTPIELTKGVVVVVKH